MPFDDAQRRAILALGPWPVARGNDPSNRVSGNANAVALGSALFVDARLSRVGARSRTLELEARVTCRGREGTSSAEVLDPPVVVVTAIGTVVVP